VHFDFRLVYNSTHSSLQARVSLRRYTANMVYLQHGGVLYCTQNDVTITHTGCGKLVAT